MLAIFHQGFAQPPQELLSPNSKLQAKHPEEILKKFQSSNSNNSFCISFNTGAALASATKRSCPGYHRRLFSCMDELHCMFVGSLNNLSSLIRQYGLGGKSTDEAMLLIEAYRTLRDRGPYPADQVLKGLDGSFAFVVYDNKNSSVFAALSSDGEIPLFWGVAADGSVVICDDQDVMKSSCAKSFAPFPNEIPMTKEDFLVLVKAFKEARRRHAEEEINQDFWLTFKNCYNAHPDCRSQRSYLNIRSNWVTFNRACERYQNVIDEVIADGEWQETRGTFDSGYYARHRTRFIGHDAFYLLQQYLTGDDV